VLLATARSATKSTSKIPSRAISEQPVSSFWQRLLNAPKGFNKYYPKGKASEKNSSTKNGSTPGEGNFVFRAIKCYDIV
jgi:hypothetical protein